MIFRLAIIQITVIFSCVFHLSSFASAEKVKNEILQKILPRLNLNSHDITDEDNLEDISPELDREIKIRLQLIENMTSLQSRAQYNLDGDSLDLIDPQWESKISWNENTRISEGKHAAFAAHKEIAWQISKELLSERESILTLDCSTFLQASIYSAQAVTLTKDQFESLYPHGIQLAPFHLTENANNEKPFSTILQIMSEQRSTVDRNRDDKIQEIEETLIPGYIVYFTNHPNYSLYCKNGAWSGEWAIYLGGRKYSGFGLEKKTADEIINKLYDQFLQVKPRGKLAVENDLRPHISTVISGYYSVYQAREIEQF